MPKYPKAPVKPPPKALPKVPAKALAKTHGKAPAKTSIKALDKAPPKLNSKSKYTEISGSIASLSFKKTNAEMDTDQRKLFIKWYVTYKIMPLSHFTLIVFQVTGILGDPVFSQDCRQFVIS